MAEKKKPVRKATVVSPSRRGEGSKPKPVAKRVSPSARGEGSTNLKATLAMKKKQAKVQEAGVANVAGTVAKAAIAVGKRIASNTPKAKAKISQQNNAKIWREAEMQARATKAKAEKELADIAKKRAKVEKMGAEGNRKAAIAEKNKGTAVRPQKAYKPNKPPKTTSKPYTDQFGNRGWY